MGCFQFGAVIKSQLHGFSHWLQCAGQCRSPSSSESFVKPFGMAPAPELPRQHCQTLADADLRRERPQHSTCENCLLFSWKKKVSLKKKKRSATENRSQHCLHNPRVLSSWPWGIWMGDNKVTYLIETGYSLTVLEQGPGCTQGSGETYKLGEEMLPRKPN